jgi:predicted polyphosphate/ATP-dependent NAD kinase
MRIGLVVNPNSGLGGAVGLKGTDGADTVCEALRLGAIAQAGTRTRTALELLSRRVPNASLFIAPGRLGSDWAAGLPLDLRISQQRTLTGTASDTKQAVRDLPPVDVLVFAGGDGTARDVMSVLPDDTAMLGLPCGVKMHSGVFAVTPSAAGAMMADLLTDEGRFEWQPRAEIMDIDEVELRKGVIAPRLYGYARTPISRSLMQAAKGGPRVNSSNALSAAAAAIVREMDPDTLYVIGPGTSSGAVTIAAGHTPTTLGVDALLNRQLVAQDTDARQLNALASDRPVRIVLGVTGQQGFLLGRGNQQIDPNIVRRAGRDGLIVLATEDKLTSLQQPRLHVDTGDPYLDAEMAGFIRVRTGANREMMIRVTSC